MSLSCLPLSPYIYWATVGGVLQRPTETNKFSGVYFQNTEFALAKLGNDASIYGCIRMLM